MLLNIAKLHPGRRMVIHGQILPAPLLLKKKENLIFFFFKNWKNFFKVVYACYSLIRKAIFFNRIGHG